MFGGFETGEAANTAEFRCISSSGSGFLGDCLTSLVPVGVTGIVGVGVASVGTFWLCGVDGVVGFAGIGFIGCELSVSSPGL